MTTSPQYAGHFNKLTSFPYRSIQVATGTSIKHTDQSPNGTAVYLKNYPSQQGGRVDFILSGKIGSLLIESNEYEWRGIINAATVDGIAALKSNIDEIVSGVNRVGPSNCVFADNIDAVPEFSYMDTSALDSRLLPQPAVIGGTVQGTMDQGNDRDLFAASFDNGAEYRINVRAVAPEDVNLKTDKDGDGRQDADAIVFTYEAEHSVDDTRELIGAITPMINILDSNGNILATSIGEEHLTLTATSTGTTSYRSSELATRKLLLPASTPRPSSHSVRAQATTRTAPAPGQTS